MRSGRGSSAVAVELLELLAQRHPRDAERLCGAGLVAAVVAQDRLDQGGSTSARSKR